ncbi:YrhB domain-containing protein [Psychroserpens sp.]
MIQIAKEYLKEMDDKDGLETIILYEQTIEKPYGCIFCYDSKLFQETGEFQYAIAGNAPFMVEKETGRVIVFGTARSTEYYIEGYENGTWEPSANGIWESKA